VPLDPGTRVVGVRMRPGAAPPLLGFDAAAVRDTRAPVQELWGAAGRRLAEALDEREDRLAVLLSLLTGRAVRARQPDPLVVAAIARLRLPRAGLRGAPSVRAVADELAVSERQLRRRFTVAVGYGPKLLARVLRLEGALAAARDGDELARVAAEAGYADQAHFANDCRALAGVPPSALLGREDVRFLQDAATWPHDRRRR
jgi:AraC-like DNA-binding protein